MTDVTFEIPGSDAGSTPWAFRHWGPSQFRRPRDVSGVTYPGHCAAASRPCRRGTRDPDDSDVLRAARRPSQADVDDIIDFAVGQGPYGCRP